MPMKPLHIETPLIESRAMTIGSGRTVWLKMEPMQPPGSYKIRGIGRACQEYARRGATRFISSSGGNAGIAVAYAGRHLSVPVVVVVPETATDRARQIIKQQGASVIVHGSTFYEANELAQSMVGQGDAFLHPFDNPMIWEGHSSLVDEVVRSGVKPDAVVLSVGGGGLLCGVVAGLRRHGWADVPVVAAETRGADSLAQSLSAGRRVELPAITSIATSLGAKKVCEQAFACSKTHPLRSVVVTDRDAVVACQRFIEDQRVVVEPACGAALAPVYGNAAELEDFESVLVVVCGGVTVTVDTLREWAKELP